jgi:hypothetical protein
MKENLTDLFSESCIGCDYCHRSLSQWKCHRSGDVDGEFICYDKAPGVFLWPKPFVTGCYTRKGG